jgi:predicted Zn-dependent peptidase
MKVTTFLRLLGCSLVSALLTMPSLAATGTVTRQQLELRGGIKLQEYVLPNGLTLIVIEQPAAPLVTIYHWVKAGSVDGLSGMAHLFEHMMFRPLAPGDVSFDEKASRLGGETDATTHFESTQYVTRVPKEQAGALLQAEAARFKGMQVTDELLDVEREAVRSEYQTRIAASPVGTLYQALYSRAFPGYPQRSAFGLPEDLDKIKAGDCNAFFARYYRPNTTGLVIGGAVSSAEIVRWVEANYGDWQRGPQLTPQAAAAGGGAAVLEGQLASPARSLVFGFTVPLNDQVESQAIRLANWMLFESSYSLAKRRLSIDQALATRVADFGFANDNGMLKGIANMLPGVSVQQMQREIGKLGADLRNLNDAEYRAYVQEFFTATQESVQRSGRLVAAAAQSWGRDGSVNHLVSVLAGQPVPGLRSKVTALVDQYIEPDNLVVVHGKADK